MVSGSGLGRGDDAHDGALLTIGDAAQRLGTSPRCVRRLIAERRIASTRIGRHVRIAPQDLVEFITAGRVEPVARARTASLH